MEKVHLEVLVKGRVQGVFFRMYTQLKAQELEITGYVRNTPNGDVQILAIGDEEQLNQFVEWCYQGSPSSSVTEVVTSDSKSSEEFSDFHIRH